MRLARIFSSSNAATFPPPAECDGVVYKGQLNQRQLDLLRRVVSDEDPVTSHDSALKTTVYALRSRGLIEKTKLAKGEWKATATETGVAVAQSGRMPPEAITASRRDAVEITAAELVSRVQDAGGELRLPDLSDDERAGCDAPSIPLLTGEALPTGKRLQHEGRDKGNLILRLVDDTPNTKLLAVEPPAIPVVQRLNKPHAIVGRCQKTSTLLNISTEQHHRALLILDAVLKEAERRGFRTELHKSQAAKGLVLSFENDDDTFRIQLAELTTRVPREPTAEERRREEVYGWEMASNRYDDVPNGRLELRVGETYNMKRFGDRERWKLESRLPTSSPNSKRRQNSLSNARPCGPNGRSRKRSFARKRKSKRASIELKRTEWKRCERRSSNDALRMRFENSAPTCDCHY